MSLKLLYRARYLMVLICGEDHPEVALIDVSSAINSKENVNNPAYLSLSEQHKFDFACAG